MERPYGASVLGKHRLIAELGRGGMADVFLAVAQGPAGFNKLSVIKQIRPSLAEDPEFLAMFLDEARLAARLNHPNVVQTNEVGHEGARYFIAMEFLEGQPLNRVLSRVGRDRFLVPMQIRILVDVLAGLHYAHELSDYDGTRLEVVHRDMTPHNVFVTYDGHVKIVDFGIAKAMNSSSETRAGVLKGKVAYMAPEQARGERVDRRADIFSVGVMLWEAIVGQRLWAGLPDIVILGKLGAGEIPSPRSVNPEVPREVERIVAKALAFDRKARYPTAADLQADLERVLVGAGSAASLREVGKLISQHFAEERARIKALVDAQLREARSISTGQYRALDIPFIDLPSSPSLSVTGAGSVPADEPSKAPSSRIPQLSQSVNPGSVTSAITASPSEPARRARRAILFPLAALCGALVAVASWLVTRGPTPTAAPAEPSVAAPAVSAAPPASAPAEPEVEIEIGVAATPANAALFIDDRPLKGNPGSKRLPRDGRRHRIRVEAPGYVAAERTVAADKDFLWEIALERAPAYARPLRTSRPSPAPEAPDPAKRSEPRSPRPLDTTNPFATP